MYNKAVAIINEVRKAVVGKDEIIAKILMAILAQGHILLEDCPGVGKTTMVLAFSKALDLSYKRLQFTPEILPGDVVGYTVINRETGKTEYRPGAALCNLFLADEINRTSSKTQSALLEAMEEGSITVDGTTHIIPRPYTVIATQNPIGSTGTQLLPESQMDRFIIKISIGYPSINDEVRILKQKQGQKFGKSEGNALWLDKTKTSSYKLYQFFVNVEDSMVINYLKIYTFLSREEIEEYERKNNEHPELREAHKALAREIITFLHGKEEYERAEKLAQSLFNNKFEDLTKQDIADLFDEQDMKEVNVDISIVDIVISVGAASSKREAREFITSGAVSLNGNKITDINQIISADMFIDNTYVIIKRGKKNYYVGKKI